MTTLTLTALRPFHGQLSITQLIRLARLFIIAERTALVIAITAGAFIGAQLLYPHDRTLPFQTLNGKRIGFQTTAGLTKELSAYKTSQVTAVIDGKNYNLQAEKVGISLDAEALGKSLKTYTWRERLIPGSIFGSVDLKSVPTKVNTSKQSTIVKALAAQSLVVPKNASVTRQADGSYKLTPAVNGVRAHESDIRTALSEVDPVLRTTTEVSTTTTKPAITDDKLVSAISKYDKSRKQKLEIAYNNTTYTLTPEQITAWSSVVTDEATQAASVSLDEAAVRYWLATSLPQVLQRPTTSTVTVLDGQEQDRSGATPGTGIDLDASVAAIRNALEGGQTTVTAVVKPLQPLEQFVRRYTATNAGLNALIGDWQKDYASLKAGVSLKEIGGQGRQAGLNETKQFSLASVYKMFVSWYAFNQIEAGKLNPNDASGVAGKTVAQCIEAGIVTSDNPCGEALGWKLGWNAVNNLARSAGLTNTNLNQVSGSPGDAATFLVKLTNGSVMNSSNTQTMLGYMGRQTFRSGIPAGSLGSSVQDKPGFSSGIWNDAAIVRGPKSSYVLVIYTNGNVGAIKDLANRINTLMQN